MHKGNLTGKSRESFHARVAPLYAVPYPGARLGPYSTREEAKKNVKLIFQRRWGPSDTDSEDSRHNTRERWSHLVATRLGKPFWWAALLVYDKDYEALEEDFRQVIDSWRMSLQEGPGEEHFTVLQHYQHLVFRQAIIGASLWGTKGQMALPRTGDGTTSAFLFRA